MEWYWVLWVLLIVVGMLGLGAVGLFFGLWYQSPVEERVKAGFTENADKSSALTRVRVGSQVRDGEVYQPGENLLLQCEGSWSQAVVWSLTTDHEVTWAPLVGSGTKLAWTVPNDVVSLTCRLRVAGGSDVAFSPLFAIIPSLSLVGLGDRTGQLLSIGTKVAWTVSTPAAPSVFQNFQLYSRLEPALLSEAWEPGPGLTYDAAATSTTLSFVVPASWQGQMRYLRVGTTDAKSRWKLTDEWAWVLPFPVLSARATLKSTGFDAILLAPETNVVQNQFYPGQSVLGVWSGAATTASLTFQAFYHGSAVGPALAVVNPSMAGNVAWVLPTDPFDAVKIISTTTTVNLALVVRPAWAFQFTPKDPPRVHNMQFRPSGLYQCLLTLPLQIQGAQQSDTFLAATWNVAFQVLDDKGQVMFYATPALSFFALEAWPGSATSFRMTLGLDVWLGATSEVTPLRVAPVLTAYGQNLVSPLPFVLTVDHQARPRPLAQDQIQVVVGAVPVLVKGQVPKDTAVFLVWGATPTTIDVVTWEFYQGGGYTTLAVTSAVYSSWRTPAVATNGCRLRVSSGAWSVEEAFNVV